MKKFITRKYIIELKESLKKEGKILSPNSNIIKDYKNNLNGINKHQLESAIGHILGDARIESNKYGTSHNIKFEWGDKNKEYAFHVYNTFKDYILTPPRKQERINKVGNKNITWCFQTIKHKDFNILGELFISNNKKVINNTVYDIISPKVIAYWFMDDGGINGNHSHEVQFNTQGFSKEEVTNLCNTLNYKYNILMLELDLIKINILLIFQLINIKYLQI